MTNLAIKGHATRGNEVIGILEMLGGKNLYNYCADCDSLCFYIGKETKIIYRDDVNNCEDLLIFTLEEFLEKLPYKNGDKVYYDNKVCDGRIKNLAIVEELKPYKEETMKTITIDDFKANTKEWLIDKLHGMIISDAIKTIGNIHDELHKPEYPKTYEECCDVLKIPNDERYIYTDVPLSYNKVLKVFTQLLICRDAYWKIAGEQIGLGEPWKPDWTNTNSNKYCIYYVGDEIKKQPMLEVHHFLAFPTQEIQDAFKENFDSDIEFCKEFL